MGCSVGLGWLGSRSASDQSALRSVSRHLTVPVGRAQMVTALGLTASVRTRRRLVRGQDTGFVLVVLVLCLLLFHYCASVCVYGAAA